jgi:hypothetical protein
VTDPQQQDASQFTKPWRELVAWVLLAGNAIFLLIALFWLIFVIDGWASGFGGRANGTFGVFIGVESIGLPMIAFLIATHVRPPVPRARLVTLGVLIEYGVSAFFGVVTYVAAFADDISSNASARFVFERLLQRTVWLALFAIAAFLVVRAWTGLYGLPRGLPRLTWPERPHPTTPAAPPQTSGWPDVPPPPMPNPPGPAGSER